MWTGKPSTSTKDPSRSGLEDWPRASQSRPPRGSTSSSSTFPPVPTLCPRSRAGMTCASFTTRRSPARRSRAGANAVLEPRHQPLAGRGGIVLRQRRATVGGPAQVPALVHPDRRGGDEGQAQGGEEGHLRGLAPERIGAGEERVEAAQIAGEIGRLVQ